MFVRDRSAASDEDADALRRRFVDRLGIVGVWLVVVGAVAGGVGTSSDWAERSGDVVGLMSGVMDGLSVVDGVSEVLGLVSASSTVGWSCCGH